MTERKHELKCIRPFFNDVISGDKRFEIRRNDRNFKCGDILVLKETFDAGGTETGRLCWCRVTYIMYYSNALRDIVGLKSGFCVMGISVLTVGDVLSGVAI